MKSEFKNVEDLLVSDLEKNHVWRYASSPKATETAVQPVKKIPVASLTGKVVGDKVRLKNGDQVWALLGNIDANNSRLTKHFLTLSLLHNNKWLSLARYHDFDYSSRGPQELAAFLGLPLGDVFPITYDITQYVMGDREALSGLIEAEPKEKLTRAQIIAMAVP